MLRAVRNRLRRRGCDRHRFGKRLGNWIYGKYDLEEVSQYGYGLPPEHAAEDEADGAELTETAGDLTDPALVQRNLVEFGLAEPFAEPGYTLDPDDEFRDSVSLETVKDWKCKGADVPGRSPR